MLKRLDHVEIVPRDFERSIAFYTRVLGFELVDRYPVDAPPLTELAYLVLNDSVIEMLRVTEAGEPAPLEHYGYRLMAWEVDDMGDTLAQLAAQGVATTWGPLEREDYIRAEVCDPDGNAIELRQWHRRPW